MMIYKKIQKKWSFELKISINYKLVFWSLISCYPRLAQLVEHQTSNQEVMSSSLSWGSFLFYARLYTVIVHCVTPPCAIAIPRFSNLSVKVRNFFCKWLCTSRPCRCWRSKSFFMWSLLSEKSLFSTKTVNWVKKRDIQCQERLGRGYICVMKKAAAKPHNVLNYFLKENSNFYEIAHQYTYLGSKHSRTGGTYWRCKCSHRLCKV